MLIKLNSTKTWDELLTCLEETLPHVEARDVNNERYAIYVFVVIYLKMSELAILSEYERAGSSKSPRIKTSDPLRWWKDSQTHFPIISRLTEKISGVTATSASIERLFSKTDFILRQHTMQSSLDHHLILSRVELSHLKNVESPSLVEAQKSALVFGVTHFKFETLEKDIKSGPMLIYQGIRKEIANEQRGAYRSVEDRHGRYVRLSDHGNGRRPSFSKGGQNEKTMENNKGFYNVNDYSREESPDLNEVELELGSIESTIDIKSISCIPKLINKKCRLVFNNDQETQKMEALFDGGERN
ncbi:hAT family dimerization domain [Brachionus plicatilis]|uniref:HAT family dimerization domain n=1 Tax=Brachionus plicatilis TaxID=10195 RepID=A0A3M7TBX3_BRAPC|nr:hAT family dimerization domain [Brachionus plicatilis]